MVEPALHEKSPLHTEGSDQEVEAHATEAVAFQEGHEETKPDKDHDMDVLEAWREEHKHTRGVMPMEKASHRKTPKLHTSLSVVRSQLQPTIVQGLGRCPLDRDLSEAALCGVDTVLLLAGHPKVADLHHVVLGNKTVSCRQVPF
ncbi:hypothetical protein EYF80_002141 [Liparis tanakae]|uniref:Uncharacterized protein n=1 Tax=Liparis tanakae TaxID=230148 RepID=A0A4Z2JC72_9TELE|nr:hypothetical protein EYF80_002141 [Liparis tanakae]